MSPIPLSQPDITEADIEAVVSVLRSSRLSLGPKLEEFETLVRSFVGVPHAVGVSSGTAGLHLCLVALGIQQGDEVIVPSFTFVAAANAIRYVQATPVFIDIEAATLNMDAAFLERAITPRTRAIMLVHTFGVPGPIDAVREIARRHNLLVIEDACEALGAEVNGQQVGSLGDAAVFAFYPNKQITTGEGGVVVTRDPRLAREIMALRNQGRYETDDWHQHSILGYNYRLSEINAALGCAQMRRLESILARRDLVARTYDASLRPIAHLALPPLTFAHARISWFVYVIRLAGSSGHTHRDEAVRQLRGRGIQCGRYFAPIHTQPAYSGHALRHPLPVTESESTRTIALPFFTNMTALQVAEVSQGLQDVFGDLAATQAP